jgi:hypothetical protein
MLRRNENGLFGEENKAFNKSIEPYYGIEEIDFRFRGTQSDPAISLKGDYTEVSCYVLEDFIYEEVGWLLKENGYDMDELPEEEQEKELFKFANDNKELLTLKLKDEIVFQKKKDYEELVKLVSEYRDYPDRLNDMANEILENNDNYITIFGKKYGYTVGNVENPVEFHDDYASLY